MVAKVAAATERLASFVCHSSPPPEVREHLTKALANWIAVAVHAVTSPEGDSWRRFWRSAGAGEGLAIGLGRGVWERAAFLNAALAHVDDYDDTHLATMTHPATPVIGAGVAVLNASHSWEQFLDAVAIGTEVTIGVAALLGPDHYARGWHVTATAGTWGAAAAAARLLALGPAAVAHALSLGGLQAAGLRCAFGSRGKAFQVGHAAGAGVVAALAAAAGVDGPLDLVEHPRGLAVVTAEMHRSVLDGLGVSWRVLEDTFKPYPTGIVTHPAIEAAVTLFRQGMDASKIERVQAEVHPLVLELTDKPQIATPLDLKFSARYLVALALRTGRVEGSGGADRIDPEVRALAEKVDLLPQASRGRDSARVRVVMRDGQVRESEVAHADGSASRPLSWARLQEKYAVLTARVPREVRDAVWRALTSREGAPREVLEALQA
ncbi:MAG: MmgE/PrpD family protein [Firmicutes bacterium]|nr:MmgE/PrpD family protein [Bacillota bacterium]